MVIILLALYLPILLINQRFEQLLELPLLLPFSFFSGLQFLGIVLIIIILHPVKSLLLPQFGTLSHQLFVLEVVYVFFLSLFLLLFHI